MPGPTCTRSRPSTSPRRARTKAGGRGSGETSCRPRRTWSRPLPASGRWSAGTGGQKRRIEFVSGTGHWYKGGDGLVPIRWVFVHDRDGTHEDRYFYSTDPSLSASKIVTLYTARWSIKVTFEEVRFYLGFHTPRCWSKNSVLRTGPPLLGLFSLVCLIYHRHTRGKGTRPLATAWYVKTQVSFADAVATVRGLLWRQTVLQRLDQTGAFQKLPAKLQRVLIHRLSYAA